MSYPLDRKLVVEFIGTFIFVFTVGMATNKAGAARWRRSQSDRR
jgi:glycerol uptake facilitator-like aquaporin